jgi:sirohydrochlorin cobaltochelatase
VLLVGHGSARSRAPATALARHASTLRGTGLFADVASATLHGKPKPDSTLARMTGDEVHVVPLFMSDGYFANAAIPPALSLDRRDRTRLFHLHPPLGIYPGLTRLIVQRALERAAVEKIAPNETTLLLIGHGSSKDSASRRATEGHAARVRLFASFHDVRTAYLEEAPFLDDVLATLSGPTIICGLFVAAGRHAGYDVPRTIRRRGMPNVHYLGAIGTDPAIPNLVLEIVTEAERPATPVAPSAP